MNRFIIFLLFIAFTIGSSHNLAADIVETFDIETANTAETVAAYPMIEFTDSNNESPGYFVSQGVLNTPLDGPDVALFAGNLRSEFTYSVMLGATGGSTIFPVGIAFTDDLGPVFGDGIRVLFHPGLTGGQFRAANQDQNIINNTHMGFTPAVGILHHMTLESFGNGDYSVTVVDGADSQNIFQISFSAEIIQTSRPSVWSGARSGIFDNIDIVSVPEPGSGVLLLALAFFLRRATRN